MRSKFLILLFLVIILMFWDKVKIFLLFKEFTCFVDGIFNFDNPVGKGYSALLFLILILVF